MTKENMILRKPSFVFLFALMIILQNNFAYAQHMNILHEELDEYIQDKNATIGIAIIYNGDKILTINNNAHYPLMSVFKFHQAIAVSKKLEIENIPLSSIIHIQKSDLQDNTYSPLRDSYPDGNIFLSVYDIFKYTLQESDNNACDILFNRFISPVETDKYIHSLGIDGFSISQNEKDMHDDIYNAYKNWSTPLAAARLLEVFISGNILSKHYHDAIKNIMIECKTGNDRLKKLLPENISIGHKTGTGDINNNNEIIGLNDIGFVFLPDNRRYTIAVLIKNSLESAKDTAQIIADISHITFTHFMRHQ